MDGKTYKMLEEGVQNLLANVKTIDPESEEGQAALTKATKMLELLITADKDEADYHDKKERRRIEKERNDAMIKIERDKQKITWGRVGLEMSKIVVPMVGSFVVSIILQNRVFIFEKGGNIITSIAGRQLRLPNFMPKGF